jgi:hypothetical protein
VLWLRFLRGCWKSFRGTAADRGRWLRAGAVKNRIQDLDVEVGRRKRGDVPGILAAMDVFVCSEMEGMPMTVLEAMVAAFR